VIQLVNDYDEDVFNGDMGVVHSVKVKVNGDDYSFKVEFDKFKSSKEAGVGTPKEAGVGTAAEKKKDAHTRGLTERSLLRLGLSRASLELKDPLDTLKVKYPLNTPSEKTQVLREYTMRDVGYDIALSYALTVHKAQGSEYEVVCMPVVSTHQFMLSRNLLYTG